MENMKDILVRDLGRLISEYRETAESEAAENNSYGQDLYDDLATITSRLQQQVENM